MSILTLKDKQILVNQLTYFFDLVLLKNNSPERSILEEKFANLFLKNSEKEPQLIYSQGSLTFYLQNKLVDDSLIESGDPQNSYYFDGTKLSLRKNGEMAMQILPTLGFTTAAGLGTKNAFQNDSGFQLSSNNNNNNNNNG